ncbi:MAG: hypothetical protein LBI63_06060 [Candidatus Ancillula sp.]|jgi:hypothetical protein|nr:hypothetical protein [Candidatus Ancillula sp.]
MQELKPRYKFYRGFPFALLLFFAVSGAIMATAWGLTSSASGVVVTASGADTLSKKNCPSVPTNAVSFRNRDYNGYTYEDQQHSFDVDVIINNSSQNFRVNLWYYEYNDDKVLSGLMECVASTNVEYNTSDSVKASFNGTSTFSKTIDGPNTFNGAFLTQVVDLSGKYDDAWGNFTTGTSGSLDQPYVNMYLSGSPSQVFEYFQLLNIKYCLPGTYECYRYAHTKGVLDGLLSDAANQLINLPINDFSYYNLQSNPEKIATNLRNQWETGRMMTKIDDFSKTISFSKTVDLHYIKEPDSNINNSRNNWASDISVGDTLTVDPNKFRCVDTYTKSNLVIDSNGFYKTSAENYDHEIECTANHNYSLFEKMWQVDTVQFSYFENQSGARQCQGWGYYGCSYQSLPTFSVNKRVNINDFNSYDSSKTQYENIYGGIVTHGQVDQSTFLSSQVGIYNLKNSYYYQLDPEPSPLFTIPPVEMNPIQILLAFCEISHNGDVYDPIPDYTDYCIDPYSDNSNDFSTNSVVTLTANVHASLGPAQLNATVNNPNTAPVTEICNQSTTPGVSGADCTPSDNTAYVGDTISVSNTSCADITCRVVESGEGWYQNFSWWINGEWKISSSNANSSSYTAPSKVEASNLTNRSGGHPTTAQNVYGNNLCLQIDYNYKDAQGNIGAYTSAAFMICYTIEKGTLDISSAVNITGVSQMRVDQNASYTVTVSTQNLKYQGWACGGFQWYSSNDVQNNGAQIDSATHNDYIPVVADYQRFLRLQVTCNKDGYYDNVLYSLPHQVDKGVGPYSATSNEQALDNANLVLSPTVQSGRNYRVEDLLNWTGKLGLPNITNEPNWTAVCQVAGITQDCLTYQISADLANTATEINITIRRSNTSEVDAYYSPTATFSITPDLGVFVCPTTGVAAACTLTFTSGYNTAKVDKTLILNENQLPNGWSVTTQTWQKTQVASKPNSKDDTLNWTDLDASGPNSGEIFKYYTVKPEDESTQPSSFIRVVVTISHAGYENQVFTVVTDAVQKGDPTPYTPQVLGVLKFGDIITIHNMPPNQWQKVAGECKAYIVNDPSITTVPTEQQGKEIEDIDCTSNVAFELKDIAFPAHSDQVYLLLVAKYTHQHYLDAQNFKTSASPIELGDTYSGDTPLICSSNGCATENEVSALNQAQVIGLPDISLNWNISNCQFQIAQDATSDDNWTTVDTQTNCTTASSHIVPPTAWIGMYLRFSADFSKIGHQNSTVSTIPVRVRTSEALNFAPSIAGNTRVGSTLSAAGVPIGQTGWSNFNFLFTCMKNASKTTLSQDSVSPVLYLTSAWLGCQIELDARGTQEGFDESSGSVITATEVTAGSPIVFTPEIVGTPEVGQVLGLANLPNNWQINAVSWMTDAREVGTGSTLQVNADLVGVQIWAVVELSQAGYQNSSSQSIAVTVLQGQIPDFVPSIVGIPKTDEILHITGLLGDLAYTSEISWYRNGVDDAISTSDTYQVQAGDVREQIYARVAVSSPGYYPVQIETPSVQISKNSITPSAPILVGQLRVGSQLQVQNTLANWNFLSQKWYYSDNAIDPIFINEQFGGYIIQPNDVGKHLLVKLVYQKDGYDDATLISAVSGEIAPGELIATAPILSGISKVDDYLILDNVPSSTYCSSSIKWYRKATSGVITEISSAANLKLYQLTAADLNAVVYATVVLSRSGYSTLQLNSNSSDVVTLGNPIQFEPHFTAEIITDSVVGVTNIPDPLSFWSLAYRWYVVDSIPTTSTPLDNPVSTTQNYTIKSTDVGKYLILRITSTRSGFETSVIQIAEAVQIHPAVSFTPYITGKHQVGNTLRIEGQPDSALGFEIAYVWTKDGEVVADKTEDNYALESKSEADSDFEHAICASVIASKPGYTTAQKVINCDNEEVAEGEPLVYSGRIDGVPKVGEFLTADFSPEYENKQTTVEYIWNRDLVQIADNTTSSYEVLDSDLGSYIDAQIFVHNYGYADSILELGKVGPISGNELSFTPSIDTAQPKVGATVGLINLPNNQTNPGWQVTKYEWFLDGVLQPQANANFVINASMVHKQLKARVTASAHGYDDVVAETSPVEILRGSVEITGGYQCVGLNDCSTLSTDDIIEVVGIPQTSGTNYQVDWYRSSNSTTPIFEGAIYRVSADDVGSTLYATVRNTACPDAYECEPSKQLENTGVVILASPHDWNPQIMGILQVGNMLEVSGLLDNWNVESIKWMRTLDSGGSFTIAQESTSLTYTLVPDDADAKMQVEVILSKDGYTNSLQLSALTNSVASSSMYDNFAPEITGNHCDMNETLKGCHVLDTLEIDGLPDNGDFVYNYEWILTDADNITNEVVGTDSVVVVMPEFNTRQLYVKVMAEHDGYDTVTKNSARVNILSAVIPTQGLSICTDSEQPKVSQIIALCGLPEGNWSVDYNWMNGKSNDSVYLPDAQDLGMNITLIASISASGWTTTLQTLTSDAVVQTGEPVEFTPRIIGTTKVGEILGVEGLPDFTTTGWTASFQWSSQQEGCSSPENSTFAVFELGAACVGENVTVSVILSKPGHQNAENTASSDTIELHDAPSFTPVIAYSGDLKLSTALWADNVYTDGDVFDEAFCWHVEDTEDCSLGTEPEITLTPVAVGKKVQLEITLRRDGWSSSTGISEPTDIVQTGGEADNTLRFIGSPEVYSQFSVADIPNAWTIEGFEFIDDNSKEVLARARHSSGVDLNSSDLVFEITPQLINHRLLLLLDLSRPGYDNTQLTLLSEVVQAGKLPITKPKLVGKVRCFEPVRMGDLLNNTEVEKVEWMINSRVVSNELEYIPTEADLGQNLSFRVTLGHENYTSATFTSDSKIVDYAEPLRNFELEILSLRVSQSANRYHIMGLPNADLGFTRRIQWFKDLKPQDSEYGTFIFGTTGNYQAEVHLSKPGYRDMKILVKLTKI